MKNKVEELLSHCKDHSKFFEQAIPLIASENITSIQCREATNCDFEHRYAEGWVGQRLYAGCEYMDKVESETMRLARQYFNCQFADVRPISGVVANLIVYTALTEPGDTVCAMSVMSGGHISHAPKILKSGKFLNGTAGGVHGLNVEYLAVDHDEMNINVEKSAEVIRQHKPKLLILGGSVLLFPHPVKELSEVAREVGAHVMYDGAHVLGLIGSGYFQDPLKEGAEVLTGSTHKTLPGPQHGVVLSNYAEDTEFVDRLKISAFPAMLSNHHLHNVAGLGVTLCEMIEFGKDYHQQVIANAKALAEALYNLDFDVVCAEKGFTESHQVLVDISKFKDHIGLGGVIEKRLEESHIVLNRNSLPWDIKFKRHHDNPGGLRIGTSEVTRLGMKEGEMEQIAQLMKKVIVDKEAPSKIKEGVWELKKDFLDVQYAFPSKVPGYEYISFER